MYYGDSITDECPMMDRGLWPIPSPSMDDDDDDEDEDEDRAERDGIA